MDRILIIEDDIDRAVAVRERFEAAGFDVAVANNAGTALQLEQRGAASVILAIGASPPRDSEIIVDLCTKYPQTKVITSDSLRRPVTPEQLLSAVQEALSRGR